MVFLNKQGESANQNAYVCRLFSLFSLVTWERCGKNTAGLFAHGGLGTAAVSLFAATSGVGGIEAATLLAGRNYYSKYKQRIGSCFFKVSGGVMFLVRSNA